MFKGTLRNKFLLSMVSISALLTWAMLQVVRERVQMHVLDEIAQGLRNSVLTFQSFQQQRESTLERSAALLATMPPLKAVMTSQDTATIQDASGTFWKLSGSELFILSDHAGKIVALHAANGFTAPEAQTAMTRSLVNGESSDWWFGGGHLFEVFFQPIYSGAPEDKRLMGILAVGYEVDRRVAEDAGRVASSRVAFGYEGNLVVATVAASQRASLAVRLADLSANMGTREIELESAQFLAASVRLSSSRSPLVTLTVLNSLDEATAFLSSLNRWIAVVGLAGVLAGSLLVFLVSTTFTKPLARLVSGVRALEQGDFDYPLEARGNDEVSALTAAFHRMRLRLQETQRNLIDSERLATIGRMASTISHDLRHPLTAILAYSEFLSERSLTEAQRRDYYQEIRIAVNRMTDEINSLLGFSKQREALHPAWNDVEEVIDRVVRGVKVLPEFEFIEITFAHGTECVAWFDAGKLERALLNLLLNAGDAVAPDTGRIDIDCCTSDAGLDIRVSDNGPGIPSEIRDNLFQPFVSHGKEKGIGLGLTIIQKIMLDHGGEVTVESTGQRGTVFRLHFPAGESALGVVDALAT